MRTKMLTMLVLRSELLRRVALVLALGFMVCIPRVSEAAPMGTAFTYQGILYDANSPADGEYDIEFTLYDDPNVTDANRVAGPIEANEVDVYAGAFTVQLDFGREPNAFNGDARWLEVRVRPGEIQGENEYVALSPRQQMTPVPYALQTRGMFVDEAGNVGISTRAPSEKLEVNGDIKVNNIRMANSDIKDPQSIRMIIDLNNDQTDQTFSVWKDGTAGTELLRIQEDGNVGIGTVLPWAKLEVQADFGKAVYGKATAPTGAGVYGAATASGSGVQNYGGYFTAGGDSGRAICGAATAAGGAENYGGYFEAAGDMGRGVYGTATAPGNVINFGGWFSARGDYGRGVFSTVDGIYGVGVYGEATATGPSVINDGGRFISAGEEGHGVLGQATGSSGHGVHGMASGSSGHGVYGRASAAGSVTNYGGYFEAAGGFYSAAVRGIATAGGDVHTMGGSFEASGDSSAGVIGSATAMGPAENYGGKFFAYGDSGRGVYGQGWASDDVQNYGGYFEAFGQTGRGVYGEAWGDSGRGVYGRTWGEGGTGVYGEVMTNSSTAVAVHGFAHEEAAADAYAGYFTGRVHITKNVTVDGNIGIGVTTPSVNLEVAGTARCKVLEITGADVAEKFPVSEQVEPGMVVAIDREHPGQLCLCRGAYNRRVAGVVSGANDLAAGAVLGNLPGAEDAIPVALGGRVWVYCDATGHGIEPGDLLTSAERAGHAMVVRDYERAQGAVIGKAMSSLKQGRGLVLVLVNLQ